MVPSWITKVVLAVAFAVMPLQGFAQTLAMLICLPQMAAHGHEAGQTSHSDGSAGAAHSHDHGGSAQHHASHDDAGSVNHSDHFCCNVVAPGLPAVAQLLSVPEFSSPVPAPGRLHYTTFLKLPQRPPLA
jgi:hypothetical protein